MSNWKDYYGDAPISIGADPELFVMGANMAYVSAHDLIPGTKDDPYKCPGGAIQVDGVAAEFNVDPSYTAEQFRDNIRQVMTFLHVAINAKEPTGITYTLKAKPTAYFHRDYFDDLPEEAKLLGCEPDFNAYTGQMNIPPHTDEPFRTGAGHIHGGWTSFADTSEDSQHFETCRKVVQQLDAVLYVASLLWDTDTKRRTLYGKLGAFRPKHYGVEYRPVSNAWLNHPLLQEYVFYATRKAIEDAQEGLWYHDSKEVQDLSKRLLSGETPTKVEILEYLTRLHKLMGLTGLERSLIAFMDSASVPTFQPYGSGDVYLLAGA